MVILSELYPMTILIRALLCPPRGHRSTEGMFPAKIWHNTRCKAQEVFNCYFLLICLCVIWTPQKSLRGVAAHNENKQTKIVLTTDCSGIIHSEEILLQLTWRSWQWNLSIQDFAPLSKVLKLCEAIQSFTFWWEIQIIDKVFKISQKFY